MKKIIIVLSILVVLLVGLLSFGIADFYNSPSQVAKRAAYQAAEERFSEYLEASYVDKISFEVGYNSKIGGYSAHCVNEVTKEKFVVYENEDGTFDAYSY
ncbi:MAG: hypothetical protein IJF54_00520 [Clostridia bacterium]|nr:hypothetical protein [Clostridia bacterium]